MRSFKVLAALLLAVFLVNPAQAETRERLVDASFSPAVEQLEQATEDGPVVDEPAPRAAEVPSKAKGSDMATLLIVAAGGFAVGILAGVMGCCLLFFAYYY